jgi:hypothetical protein
MRTIRASEIGAYLYCQRAWWYQRLGYQSKNQAELASGQEIHARHGRSLFMAGVLRTVAIGLLLLSIVLFIAYLAT